MLLDPQRCYRALRSRDSRFDGRFFLGVVTTGVYCRPVCPAPTPRARNVRFFACAAAAEAAGFRPCRRCRPETAPGTPAWSGSSATVARGLRLIADGALDAAGVDELAARLGVGSRHLRRLFTERLGAAPLALARTRRIHFARRLVDETELPMTRVALEAGFRSVRQFNHAMRTRFDKAPRTLRREARHRCAAPAGGDLTLRLPFRPPLAWTQLLDFLARRATPGVESVERGVYRRTFESGGQVGVLEVEPAAAPLPELRLRLPPPQPGPLLEILECVRRLFDLAADPLQIAADLGRDPLLAPRIARHPGLRVPGAWDPFEIAVRAVIGQQVTVRGATTLTGRLVRAHGKPLDGGGAGGLSHLFPRPETLAEADLARIGLPRPRAESLRRLSGEVATGALVFDPATPLEETVARLRRIPGVGDWTAQYVAMRALGEPDAFPAGDLGLRRALARAGARLSASALERRAEAWRPWRAYAAMLLWTGAAPAVAPRGGTRR